MIATGERPGTAMESISGTPFEAAAPSIGTQPEASAGIAPASPLPTYLGRMKRKGQCPPRKPLSKILWSCLGSFLGIFLIAMLGSSPGALGGTDGLFLIGSFGASAVLVYGAPMAEFSQPRNLVFGHLLSALVGVTVYRLLPDPSLIALSSAAAVSLSILAMHLTCTLHPPGGATALIAVIGSDKVHQLGYSFLLTPVLTGALLLLVVALVVNNLSTNPKRHYPHFW